MNYKIYIYIIMTMIATFGITSLNFESIVRKNKYWETRVLAMSLSFSLGYLMSQFIINFLNL
ncbi:MAG: DUF1146 domain-containing protein [Firmicutes bacterium]|nr:DUF1146 domain-containing protein [Bacillota bacterium]